MTVSELQVVVSADTHAAETGLASLGAKVGSVGSAIGTAFGAAAIGGIAALAGGLTASVAAASTFESAMSAIKAVSGATGSEMEQLSGLALQLGADTSFSASEAAAGIGELIKAGVSIGDVMGGGAAAALNLAAAGGLSVAESAEIASNAMNVFSLKGADVGHVADVIAGAANASAIDVHDFGMSLAASGSVAATVGIGFDDLGTAIAVMGQAGIKGSDAGTSLKTMLLNLTPASKAQMAVAKELGIVTADGANKFFDATGKAKSMAEIAEVLKTSTAGLTEQQKLQALQTLFGTDAIRAAAIMAKAGAEGFDTMAESIGKVSAADVAQTRLDNLKGSLEQLGGSLETAGIKIGTAFLPGLKSIVDGATQVVNEASPILESFAAGAVTNLQAAGVRLSDSWTTVKQAFAGNWAPSDQIDPFVNAVGQAALKVKEFGDFIAAVGQKASDMGALTTFKYLVIDIQVAAASGWQDAEKLAAAIARIGGSSQAASDKVTPLAAALQVIGTALDLVVINAGFLNSTIMTMARVFADAVSSVIGAGKTLAGTLTGDMALAREGALQFMEATVDMKDAAEDWKTKTGAAFSAGAADIKNLVGSGAAAAAAEHERGLQRMAAVTQDNMRLVEANTELGMSAAATAVETGGAQMSSAMDTSMTGVVSAVETQSPAAVAAAETMGTGMATAIETAGPQMSTAAETAATGVVSAVEGQTPAAAAAADAMGAGMASGVESGAAAMAPAAEGAASAAVSAVQGQTGAASGAGQSLGEALGSGLEGGIGAYVGRVAAAAGRLVSAAIGAARAEADAHSPSKKTEKLGEDLADGLEVGLNKSNLGAEMQAKIRDFVEASRDYIPVAGQIAQVESRIKEIRDQALTDALFRGQEMVTLDSETLRIKQQLVETERDQLRGRQDLAAASREVADIERGTLPDRTALIAMDAQRKQLRLQEIDLEKQLIAAGKDETRRKAIQEQIDKLRDQDRLLGLEADRITTTNSLYATSARVRKEVLDDQAHGYDAIVVAIKNQIDTLGAERAVFDANEAVIKNATQNEIDYRNRLIAVFTAEGKPLADRVTAGLALVAQLEKEGKISKELADQLRAVAQQAGFSTTGTQTLGSAAAVAAPQLDAAAQKAQALAAQEAAIAAQAQAAAGKVSALAASLGKLPSWFTPTGSAGANAGGGSGGASNGGGLFRTSSNNAIVPAVSSDIGGDTIVIDARGAQVYDGSKFVDMLVSTLEKAERGGRIVKVTR